MHRGAGNGLLSAAASLLFDLSLIWKGITGIFYIKATVMDSTRPELFYQCFEPGESCKYIC